MTGPMSQYPKPRKTKKTKKAEPMSQYLAWGQYFWSFCFFWFFEVKQKNKKRQNLCPSIWHGVITFGFLVSRGFCNFLVSDMGSAILFCLFFFEVFAIFWYLTWVLQFCFFVFSRFLQYSAFPNKTLASFPKKIFFS